MFSNGTTSKGTSWFTSGTEGSPKSNGTPRTMSVSSRPQPAKTPPAMTTTRTRSVSVTAPQMVLTPTVLSTVVEKTGNPSPKSSPVLHQKRPEAYLQNTPTATIKPNTGSTSAGSSTVSSPPGIMSSAHPVTFARPPPREMDYIEREHPRNVFEYLNEMRQRGDLCDVTLLANTEEIRAHKVVLAACSQYFEQMFIGEFAEPDNEPIFIEEVEEDALIALVDFAYTSRIKLTDHNIYSVFEAADLLQFSGVKGACFKFFKQQMNKSNCIRTWLFAESHNCTELLEASLKYIECNFLDIVNGREFLSLEQPDVVARLAGLEDLAITSEEQVYEAVLGWLHRDPERRKEHAPVVFKGVRFPSISREYLLHIVDNEPFIKEDPDCLQQLIDALESHVTTVRATLRRKLKKQGGGNYCNMTPRPASMAVEVS